MHSTKSSELLKHRLFQDEYREKSRPLSLSLSFNRFTSDNRSFCTEDLHSSEFYFDLQFIISRYSIKLVSNLFSMRTNVFYDSLESNFSFKVKEIVRFQDFFSMLFRLFILQKIFSISLKWLPMISIF